MSSYQLGLDQGQRGGTDYPLVVPTDELLSSLADLQLIYEPEDHRAPLSITQAFGFGDVGTHGGAHAADLVIVDVANALVADTRLATEFRQKTWGADYLVYQWKVGETWVTAIKHVGTAAVLPAYVAGNYVIDSRAVRPQTRQVNQLEFYRGASDTPDSIIPQGSLVRLNEGFNVGFDYTAPETRDNSGERLFSEVGLSVGSGNGAGVFDDCDDAGDSARLVRSIAGTQPDGAGNFMLSGDMCFRIEPAMVTNDDGTVSILPGQLIIADDCKACCDCDDFEAVYRAMVRLRRRFSTVAEKLTAVQNRYHKVRDELLSRMNCSNALAHINAAQTAECVVSAAVSICNTSGLDADSVSLRLTATRQPFDGSPAETGRFAGFSYHAIRYRGETVEGVGRTTGVNWDADYNSVEAVDIDMGCVPQNDTRSAALMLRFPSSGRYTICASLQDGITPGPGEQTGSCREVDVNCDYPFYYYTTTSGAESTTTDGAASTTS